jgi:hypothetical protein
VSTGSYYKARQPQDLSQEKKLDRRSQATCLTSSDTLKIVHLVVKVNIVVRRHHWNVTRATRFFLSSPHLFGEGASVSFGSSRRWIGALFFEITVEKKIPAP